MFSKILKFFRFKTDMNFTFAWNEDNIRKHFFHFNWYSKYMYSKIGKVIRIKFILKLGLNDVVGMY